MARLRHVDLLATPTVPIPAPRIGQSTVEIGGKTYPVLDAIWRNSFQTNLTGSPSLCLPCGLTEAGLPVSLQLIGRTFDELALLQAGAALQAATKWHQQTPILPD